MGEREELTSASLGIAKDRKPDLMGYILSPQEMQEGIIAMLIKAGVAKNSIHSVKITKDKDNQLSITATVEVDGIKETFDDTSAGWIGSNAKGRVRIKTTIYNELRNKAFEGNMHYQQERIKGDDYLVLNFNSEILLAFLYDVDITDEFLRIVPVDAGTNKNARRKLNYTPSGAIMTFGSETKGFNPHKVAEVYCD